MLARVSRRWLPLLVLLLSACGGGTATPERPTPAMTLPASATAVAVAPSATTTSPARPTGLPITASPRPSSPTPSSPPATPVTAIPPAGTPRPVTLRIPEGPGTIALTETRTLTLPEGFQIAVFAAGLKRARFMAWSPEGDLVISELGSPNGAIMILPDRNRDGVADGRIVFARGLRNPHGLAFHAGYLYVAEEQEVVRFAWQGGAPATTDPEVVVPGLPAGSGHYTRTIGFGPDGGLYVSIGSSCNVCVEQDQRRATIMRYNADGSNGQIYARGLRNAVGFVWRPGTVELWATNNGRDNLGDDQPPETIDLVHEGDDFGWPYCHSGHIPDPRFGRPSGCAGVAAPAVELQAHSAPLGLAFYPGGMFPADYDGDLLVAFHGSWNRSVPTGYKVVRVRFAGGRPTGQVEDFITGWLDANGAAWGRPVDPIVGPDGAVYLSDDALGVVYRITYHR